MMQRDGIRRAQLTALQGLLSELSKHGNGFYKPRLGAAGLTGTLESLEHFTRAMPFTLKSELAEDQRLHPPYGCNLTYPLERYVRIHQTSGTSGTPLRWLDTRESWSTLLDQWQRVFQAAGIGPADRMFFPFPSAPFSVSGPPSTPPPSSAAWFCPVEA